VAGATGGTARPIEFDVKVGRSPIGAGCARERHVGRDLSGGAPASCKPLRESLCQRRRAIDDGGHAGTGFFVLGPATMCTRTRSNGNTRRPRRSLNLLLGAIEYRMDDFNRR
jgi:hypothetical protein